MSKKFSSRLKYLITDRKIKQVDLANDIGITESALSHYLAGDREPSNELLANLATALDTTTDYLLGKNDNPDEEPYEACHNVFMRNSSFISDEEKIKLIKIILNKLDDEEETER